MAVVPGEKVGGIGLRPARPERLPSGLDSGPSTAIQGGVWTPPKRGGKLALTDRAFPVASTPGAWDMARPKPLADLLDICLGPALAAQGFASADILAAWPDIVGPRLAAACRPVRIEWSRRGLRDRDERPQPALLVVRVEGAFALELQHVAPLLIERINAYYGWRCIGRIVLKQGPVRRAHPAPAKPAPARRARTPAHRRRARRRRRGRPAHRPRPARLGRPGETRPRGDVSAEAATGSRASLPWAAPRLNPKAMLSPFSGVRHDDHAA